MKPHLLMLLLLAIPPLVASLLACESAEKSEPSLVAEKSCPVPAQEVAATLTPAGIASRSVVPAFAKLAPTHTAPTLPHVKP